MLEIIRGQLLSYFDNITANFGNTALASNKWLQYICLRRTFYTANINAFIIQSKEIQKMLIKYDAYL